MLAAIALMTACAHLPAAPGRQVPVAATGADDYSFLLFVPRSYATPPTAKGWPLLVFLHGSGERGANLELIKAHGPPRLVADQPDFPFIVVSPQLEADGDWSLQRLDRTLERALRALPVDRERILLTGLSRGGRGTWNWATAKPDLFAAIAPICGGGEPAQACALRDMPVWAFHGLEDVVVPPSATTDMIDAIRACGGTPRVTLYPGVNHGSWEPAYADPELFRWLLAQKRRAAP
jgi:predicted peptidase